MPPTFSRSVTVWAWRALVATLCALGLVVAWQPSRALAGSCAWTGTTNGDWNDANNWSCASGVPTQADDVTIPSGTPHSAYMFSVNGSKTIKSLTLQGYLSINPAVKLTVLGTTTTLGGAQLSLDGEISSTLFDVQGGTTLAGGFGLITGPVHVELLATLEPLSHTDLTISGHITVDGALYSPDINELFLFTGNLFSNNGQVNGPYVHFVGSSLQAIDGTGQWIGAGDLTFENGITTTLNNSMQMSMGQLHTAGGSTLDIGNNTLTLIGTQLLVDPGTSVGGGGTLRLDNATFGLDGVIRPSVLVTHTVTGGGLGTVTGAISVTRGATLTVGTLASGGSVLIDAAGDLLVDGVLNGKDLSRQVIFSGPTLVNNGLVDLDKLTFAGASQTVRGAGTYSSTAAEVYFGTQLQLGSDQQLYSLSVRSTAGVDLKAHTLALNQNGMPLINDGTITTTGSTVVYNGTLTQTIENFHVRYHSLTIGNTAIALAPVNELYVAGDFSNYGIFKHSNGTLILDGAGPQFINGVNTDFYRMTVMNTQGVTLTTNASVTSTLGLGGDLRVQAAKVLTFGGSSVGDYDVWGTVKRTGFVADTGYMFGSPYVVITPTAGTSLPTEISLTLLNHAPSGLPFAVPRTYVIAPTNGSAFTATLQLHYRDGELGTLAEGTLQMWRLNGGQWTRWDKQLWNTDQDWLQRRNISDFGTWALAAGSVNFLPLVVR